MKDSGGHRGRHGLGGLPQQKHPIDEVHDRPGGRRHDQWKRHDKDIAHAATARPPIAVVVQVGGREEIGLHLFFLRAHSIGAVTAKDPKMTTRTVLR